MGHTNILFPREKVLRLLKGKKHGGANLMVMNMMDDIKSHVKAFEDEEEIPSFGSKILKKQAFDQKGLIYGMGHAVYSISIREKGCSKAL